MFFSLFVPAILVLSSAYTHAAVDTRADRPFLSVPALTLVRNILANLEAPIVVTVVQRFSLPVDASLYQDNRNTRSELYRFLVTQEQAAAKLGRYDYGTLEYPYTLPPLFPDVATQGELFPAGRFHQDSFFENANLTKFYTKTFIPLFDGSIQSFFFHLSNQTTSSTPGAGDKDAALALDATLLALLSNRVHIGKAVAEAKFASNSSLYEPLIKAQNATAIRTLLTNTTQEQVVMQQADAVALTMTAAWASSGEQVASNFQTNIRNATQKLFRALIDMTTNVEIEYLLQRL